ncbi:uncharacterized protein LOC110443473 [Mizuhopecten yessoensis]|uniref:Uncharacterized protein n=1 Tax=Mizuhopecten yessoensis TaxID=6573 RepID=A0A210PEU4_MIZYE|nr:uncharacterized protein LOC110443473 [Mizuhopecten yessoensis]OWF35005.1 hypothetical protein KP79_PYT22208 [Mizuhopecten yessoensis]
MATCLTISGDISRVILIIINASGLAFALFLIAFASNLRVNPDNSFGTDYESTEKALLVSVVSKHPPDNDTSAISQWHLKDADVFNTFFLAMWLGGGLLLIVSVVGLIMAAKKSSGGLLVHGGFLFILLICEIALYGMLSNSTVAGNLKDSVPLKSSIQGSMYTGFKDYGGIYGTDANSIGWSVIMLKYDCCGVYGWTQYETLTENTQRPIKLAGTFICCELDNLKLYLNGSCWAGGVHTSDKNDCYDAIVEAILSSTVVQLIPLIYIAQIVMILCAILIILDNKYTVTKVEPEDDNYPEKPNALNPRKGN